MSLLDFLTQRRPQYHEAQTIQPQNPGDVALRQAPTMTQRPSLLSQAWNFAKDPGTLAAVGAGLKGLGGDDSGVAQAMQLGEQRRQTQMQEQLKAEKKAELAKKNAAFKAAYVAGPNGKHHFDPAAYAAALGDGAGIDLGEVANLHNALAPKVGVSGDTPYAIDDEGGVTWGEARGPSQIEQQQAAREAEIERHNREMERLMGGRAQSYDYSVHHKGGGGHGGGIPPPPGDGLVRIIK